MTTSIKELHYERALSLINRAENVLVVTHVNPDGDAIGSMLGLVNAWRAAGKLVECAVDDGVPETLMFLPGADTVQSKLVRGTWDVMISTDASDEVRTGSVGEYGRQNSKRVINLDHHATNDSFGDIMIVDSEAGSAAQVVYEWLVACGMTIDQHVAIPLLTGMVTDTLGFRTSNVTPEMLGIAQNLMKAGASLTEITQRTLDTRSYLTVNLWKHALSTVELHQGGLVTADITQDAIKQAGLHEATDFGLVGFLVRIDEAMISAVFKETDEGAINISMRAKPGYDVSGVAAAIGGGGHRQASGATVPGTLAEVKAKVMPLLRDAAKAGKLVIA